MGGAQPIPHPSGMTGLDWAPKPVRPGRSGRMAEEGGEQRQPEHLRAPSQWVGWPTFLSPTPGSRTCVHCMGYSRPCPAGWGKRGVPQGMTEFQAWGAPAQPCMAPSVSSGAGHQGRRAWHLVTACCPHPGGSRAWGGCRTPLSQPAPKSQSLAVTSRLLDGGGAPEAGLLPRWRWWDLEAAPLLTGKLLAGPHFLQQGQRSSKSTPLAGFLLLKPGLMRDSPGHRLLTPGPGQPL